MMYIMTLPGVTHLPVTLSFRYPEGKTELPACFLGMHAHTTSSKLLPLKAVFRIYPSKPLDE